MDIEQSTLIWIARVIFFLIALVISYGVWYYMRRERIEFVQARQAYQPPTNIELPEKDMVITVMTKPGRVFDTLKLFKIMHELGFNYSENQVFEYFVTDTNYIAFSLINIRKPYRFSQEMPPTNGLVAVMSLPVADGDQQVDYFHLLLSVLDELRTNLDAELCDGRRNPLKSERLFKMQKEIEAFEHTYLTAIQYEYQNN